MSAYWRLEKEFRFEAAHDLANHKGKCSRLHGHSYRGVLILESDRLKSTGSETGMVRDFGDIASALEQLVPAELDHQYLNDSLGCANPTAELIAKYCFDKLVADIPELVAVRIEETATCSATYWGAGRTVIKPLCGQPAT